LVTGARRAVGVCSGQSKKVTSMSQSLSRRRLLQNLTVGVPLLPLVALNTARAADLPLLSPDAKEATAVKYVEDASKAKEAVAGRTCANCGLYQGKTGAPSGPCQIFAGKAVKAAGWCSSWAPQM
jgi:ribosomal protein L32